MIVARPAVSGEDGVVELGNVLFKGELFAGLVRCRWVWMSHHLAQIPEVRLRGSALGERAGLPAFDKLRQGEGHKLCFSSLEFFQKPQALPSASLNYMLMVMT